LVRYAFPSLQRTVRLLIAELSPNNLVVRIVSVLKGVLMAIKVEIYLVVQHNGEIVSCNVDRV
jgi:hypothetical protein